jgi:hypothetical protein
VIKYALTINGNPASVAVDSNDPNASAFIKITGDDGTFADWLALQCGAFGHLIGESTSPIDLDYALSTADAQQWQPTIIEGSEMVVNYKSYLPDGAVS